MSGAEVVALVSVVVAGIASPAILSWAAARRQGRDHAAQHERDVREARLAREREERDHLRAVLDEGAGALRKAMGALRPGADPPTTVEDAVAALTAVVSLLGRLQLYLPLEHPVVASYDRTIVALYGLSSHASPFYPAGVAPPPQAPGAAREAAARAAHDGVGRALDAYYAACRALLGN